MTRPLVILAALVVAAAVAPQLVLRHPARASDDSPPERFIVRAGHADLASVTDDSPFIHTAFYPSALRVHRDDTIEWRFGAGYGGWHSVFITDGAQEPPGFFRADETPGTVALDEEFGSGRYPDGTPCGRIGWYSAPDLEPCELTTAAVSAGVGSAVFERFFSTSDPGAFVAHVDPALPYGTYTFGCRFHVGMRGELEVVPDDVAVASQPTIDAAAREAFAADRAAAETLARDLGDARRAWDPVAREWRVRVGAETPDRRVGIYQFLPATVPARRGDRVRFIAGTQEPNAVMFVDDVKLQGGFNAGGRCLANRCTAGQAAPWGLTGLAYPWFCDYDAANGGAAGMPLAFVPPRTSDRLAATPVNSGCPAVNGLTGALEFHVGPYMAYEQRAPGDLVTSPSAGHNSGIILDASLPDSVRSHPYRGAFPSEFEAVFPTTGEFPFICNAHEFMNGAVRVS